MRATVTPREHIARPGRGMAPGRAAAADELAAGAVVRGTVVPVIGDSALVLLLD